MGAFVGVLPINAWDLLQPARMQCSEFEAARSRLLGFSQQTRDFPIALIDIGAGRGSVSEVDLMVFVQRSLNVFLVQGAGLGELMFAGAVRKGLVENRAFITLLTTRYRTPQRCTPHVLCRLIYH